MNQSPTPKHRNFLTRLRRWMLRLDVPLPELSDEEYEAEVQRNYRWNFIFNMLDGASFWFGMNFVAPATLMPLFISKLTDSKFAIGMLSVIVQSAYMLPQIFTANFIEQLPRKKPVVINAGFFWERLPFWLIVPVIAFLAVPYPHLTVVLFLFLIAWHAAGAGALAPAWLDMLARCFPTEKRGRFFGTTSFLGAGAGVIGAALSAKLLASAPYPRNFVYTFAAAAFLITLSWVFLAQVREPVRKMPTPPPQSLGTFLKQLPRTLREDHNYRRFLIARTLLAWSGMGSGFITVALVQRWHVPDFTVGVYTSVMLAAQMFSNLMYGLLSDRYGHKLSLVWGSVCILLAFLLAWLGPSPAWAYAVYVLLGLGNGAFSVSGMLIVLEFSAPERRPTYTGIANTITGLSAMVAPLVGTWLAYYGYNILFALSALVNLLGLLTLQFTVREPREISYSSG